MNFNIIKIERLNQIIYLIYILETQVICRVHVPAELTKQKLKLIIANYSALFAGSCVDKARKMVTDRGIVANEINSESQQFERLKT